MYWPQRLNAMLIYFEVFKSLQSIKKKTIQMGTSYKKKKNKRSTSSYPLVYDYKLIEKEIAALK